MSTSQIKSVRLLKDNSLLQPAGHPAFTPPHAHNVNGFINKRNLYSLRCETFYNRHSFTHIKRCQTKNKRVIIFAVLSTFFIFATVFSSASFDVGASGVATARTPVFSFYFSTAAVSLSLSLPLSHSLGGKRHEKGDSSSRPAQPM